MTRPITQDNDESRAELAAHAWEKYRLKLERDGNLPDGGPAYKLTTGPLVVAPKSDLETIEAYLTRRDESPTR